MTIHLPYKFEPRDYQSRGFKALFIDKYKHILKVLHRRAGKTKFAVNAICGAAFERKGIYYHGFPQLNQARRNVWEAIGGDGLKFLDHFPTELIEKVNNSEMKIEFKNGSIYRLLGSDRYSSWRGSNPVGIIFDEFSEQDPLARDYSLPILLENGGWEIILSTPRGTNHLYKLYQNVKEDPDWYCELLGIDQTERNNGLPVVDKKEVEAMVNNGSWSQDKVDQEFYCSFTAAIQGSYFNKEISIAEKENRIHDFIIDRTTQVHTAWDIGFNDASALWMFQIEKDSIKIINYYENRFESLDHYINYLEDFRGKNRIVYGKHFAPHDANNRNFTYGKSTYERARELGFNFQVLPRLKSKRESIEESKAKFNKMIFHETNCARGLECLREYHSKYNDAMDVFSNEPVHNWASHGADAYLYLVASLESIKQSNFGGEVLTNRVGTQSLW